MAAPSLWPKVQSLRSKHRQNCQKDGTNTRIRVAFLCVLPQSHSYHHPCRLSSRFPQDMVPGAGKIRKKKLPSTTSADWCQAEATALVVLGPALWLIVQYLPGADLALGAQAHTSPLFSKYVMFSYIKFRSWSIYSLSLSNIQQPHDAEQMGEGQSYGTCLFSSMFSHVCWARAPMLFQVCETSISWLNGNRD